MARRNSSRRTAGRSTRNRTRSHQSRSFTGRSLYHRKLRLEPLEDRRLLAVVTVTTLSDTVDFSDGLTSLREAIFAANIVPGADTINFAPALTAGGPAKILLTQGELAITDSLAINGPGASLLTIDASGSDPTPGIADGKGSRIFNIGDNRFSPSTEVTIGRLTLTGGDSAFSGGAISSLCERLTLRDAIVTGNTSSNSGGGVYAHGGTFEMYSTTISNNNVARDGGGIYAVGNTLISDSVISGNQGGFGGGAHLWSYSSYTHFESTVVRRTLIKDNTAIRQGGGMLLGGRLGSRAAIEASDISHNSAGDYGGSIYSRSGLTISDSTITGNVSARGGGGVAQVSLENLEITDSNISGNSVVGIWGRGGGILCISRSQTTIANSVVSGNIAPSYGGGISNSGPGASLTVSDSVILDNSAGMGGGGIYSAHGRALVSACDISGNLAGSYGGGIAIVNGLIGAIADSSIKGNFAGQDGGGIFSNGPITLTNNMISGNTAARDGGGLCARVNSPVVYDDTFSDNSAGRNGGGITVVGTLYLNDPEPFEISDSTMSGNSAGALGGGIWTDRTTRVSRATIYENHADEAGGGLFVSSGSLAPEHTIVAGNTALMGPDVSGLLGVTVDAHYSLIGSNAGSGLAATQFGSTDANGNLIGSPLNGVIDPKLGPLADNGGLVLPDGSHILTMALLPGSPAINAGDLNAVAGQNGVPEFDERGTPFGRVFGGRIDIGAFEYQAPSDLNLLVDTLVDESDGNYSRGDLSLREAIELANHYSGADTIHFDPALTAIGPATILLTHGELKITDSLTIEGPGADALIIDAQQQSRIFDITAMTGDYTVHGLTLTGGKVTADGAGSADPAVSGGAILCATSGLLTLDHDIITANSVTGSGGVGGGVYARGVTVADTTISHNSAGFGGGIYAETLTLDGSTVTGNSGAGAYASTIMATASTVSDNVGSGLYGFRVTLTDSHIENNMLGAFADGGGVYAKLKLSLTNCVVVDNSAGSRGGGLSCDGDLTLVDSTVSGNSAGDAGGGIFAGGLISLTGSKISENNANRTGGGIYSNLSPEIDATHCSITGNKVTGTGSSGGGIFVLGGLINLLDSDVSSNSAVSDGGGISGNQISIQDSTVTNNTGAWGGGIYARFIPTLSGSTISGNKATGALSSRTNAPGCGGGIFVATGTLTASDCMILNNTAAGARGGGIFAGSDAKLTDCMISGNSTTGNQSGSGISAKGGGGVFSGGNLTLDHCSIDGNSTAGASAGGGGVAAGLHVIATDSSFTNNATKGANAPGGGITGGVTLTNCIVTGNSTSGANASGGGVFGAAAATNCVISNNRTAGANATGGGIYTSVQLTLVESTVSGNSTSGSGANGGGVRGLGRVVLASSTITGNHVDHASAISGGIYMGSSLLDISNSIVAGNAAAGGQPDLRAVGNMNRKFSLIGDNSGTGLGEAPVGSPDSFGNLIGGPVHGVIDPMLGPLADNGGFALPDGSHILTHALLPGSPAIDAGDPSAAAGVGGVPVNDQRGVPFTRVFGGRIDVGAVEYEPAGFLAGDYNGNGIVDAADYTRWRDSLSSHVAAGSGADGNGDAVVNQLDYDVWKANFGATLPMGGGGAGSRPGDRVPRQGAGSGNQGASGEERGASVGTGGKAEGGRGKADQFRNADFGLRIDQSTDDLTASATVSPALSIPPAEPGAARSSKLQASALRTPFETAARRDLLLEAWLATRDRGPQRREEVVTRRYGDDAISHDPATDDTLADAAAAFDCAFAILGRASAI